MDGDPETGVTIMRVVKALDAGPMLDAVRRSDRAGRSTSDELERTLAIAGATCSCEVVDRLAAGPVVETPQDEAGVT